MWTAKRSPVLIAGWVLAAAALSAPVRAQAQAVNNPGRAKWRLNGSWRLGVGGLGRGGLRRAVPQREHSGNFKCGVWQQWSCQALDVEILGRRKKRIAAQDTGSSDPSSGAEQSRRNSATWALP